jgi:putative MATE family efflux protein
MKNEDKKMFKLIITMAIPTVIEYTLQSLSHYADLIMVGKLGENATAAIGITREVDFLLRSIVNGFQVGIVAYVALMIGRGEHDKLKSATIQSMYLSLWLGFLLLFLGLGISPYFPKWMGADKNIRNIASDYFAIVYMSSLGLSFKILLCSTLRGVGDMKTPMYVNVGVNLLNIVLNYFLIYGNKNVHIAGFTFCIRRAGLGVSGAALATSISNIIGGILAIIAVYNNKLLTPKTKRFEINRDILTRIVTVSLPAFICNLCTCFGRVIFTSFVTGLGTTVLAAHNIAGTAESAFFMPILGIENSVVTLSGNAKGERNTNKFSSLVRNSCKLVFFGMIIMCLLMIVTSE